MRGSINITKQVIISTIGGMLFGSVLVESAAAVPLVGTDYAQNFDTLANSGTSSSLPDDWEFSESGTGANAIYSAGAGTSGTGNTYSFGAGSSTDRALGGLQSGSLIPSFGVHFENGGTTPIISLTISYTGEQWRLGTAGRIDRLDFQSSLDATSLVTGTWTDLNALDFVAPVASGTLGAMVGNESANRSTVSSTITGLSLVAGSSFWLRWTDLNATGADDGLAIDDFSISAVFDRASDPDSSVPDAGTSLALFGLSLTGLGLFARRRT